MRVPTRCPQTSAVFFQQPGPSAPSQVRLQPRLVLLPGVVIPRRRRARAREWSGGPSHLPPTPSAPSSLRGHPPSAEPPPPLGPSRTPATLRHLRPVASKRSRKKDASLIPRPPTSPAPSPPRIGWRGCRSFGAARPLARRVLPFWLTARPRSGLTMGVESQTGSGLVPWSSAPL